MAEKVNVTIRLEKDAAEFPDELGKPLSHDRISLIEEAVESYISLRRWQIEEIKKAVAEADAGDFASDEEVEVMFNEVLG
jgi:predicted transcriptional regulator